MSSSDVVVILDSNYYQSLLDNKKLMIDNIIFSPQMIDLCIEKKIVGVEDSNAFKKAETNAEKIDLIIQNLRMKQTKYFISFCEILVMSGQPIIAQLLQEAATNEIEFDIEELLSDMPLLRKALRPKDKEQLMKFISDKAKMECLKAVVTQAKQNHRKESIARVTQIQQSWKFQKDIKEKEKESDELKEQLLSIEDQLEQKQHLLNSITRDLREKQRKQEEDLLMASTFNAVNDRELQRVENSRDQYKTSIENVMSKLRMVIPTEDKFYEKLLHESSMGQMKKYDVQKQMEIFQNLVDQVLEIFNILVTENANFEILKKEVISVQRMILPHREPSQFDSLMSYIQEYQKQISNTVHVLQSKLELQDNFIHGRIRPEFVPDQFKNIQISSFEREEYNDIIKELRAKITNLESLLKTKENDFNKFMSHKMSEDTEIFLEPNNHSTDVNTENRTKDRPSQNNDSVKPGASNGIPFSYSSNYKSRPARIIQNRSKRTNVLKFNSVNLF